ncbi:MAG: HEAT repeat domain-containing protein [Campylobacterales bacterium]|nr:HEAT repeat domain-containing protein [Campylobacterales bacterium]
MALIKKHVQQKVEELPQFKTLEDAIKFFESNDSLDKKDYCIDEIAKFEGAGSYLVSCLAPSHTDKYLSTKIASIISAMNPQEAPIEEIMNLLKLDNAYVRNLGISILRNFGDAIKYYIVKFLIGDDRDLRIFAINVLGDVNFHESRDMMIELLETEQDINVAMTAVDYLSEIGEMSDIPLLESLKKRFVGEFYAEFAVDSAIKSIKG